MGNPIRSSLEVLMGLLPKRISDAMEAVADIAGAEEIRLRVGRAPQVVFSDRDAIVEAAPFTSKEAKELTDRLCRHSVYAHEEELKQGFIAYPGGVRVGVVGRPVIADGRIIGMTEPSCFCLRVSREAVGCAEELMRFLTENGRPVSALIAAPPGGGKTTLLRDAARCFSCGIGAAPVKVAVADERGELAGCIDGAPAFLLGPRTDVMELAPKAEAIRIFIRTMSPELIITDEIGGKADAEALAEASRCGAAVIATAHAADAEDLVSREALKPVLGSGVFKRILLLSRRGNLLRINPVKL